MGTTASSTFFTGAGFAAGTTIGAGATTGWMRTGCLAVGSSLEGAGIIGLSCNTSLLWQPAAKPRVPNAIAEMTAIPVTLIRLFFTSKPPVCDLRNKYFAINYPDRMISQARNVLLPASPMPESSLRNIGICLFMRTFTPLNLSQTPRIFIVQH